jgi:hypothetical protein
MIQKQISTNFVLVQQMWLILSLTPVEFPFDSKKVESEEKIVVNCHITIEVSITGKEF